jgi:hypothetical protein
MRPPLELSRIPVNRNSVKPTHYQVSLRDLQLGGSWGYNGVVNIAAKVYRPTKEVVLNVKEIEIQAAVVTGEDGMTEDDASTARALLKQYHHCRNSIGKGV